MNSPDQQDWQLQNKNKILSTELHSVLLFQLTYLSFMGVIFQN